jgi:hypothetical protein
MIITPKEKTNEEVKIAGRYVCPTCQAQTTTSKVEIGWVSCPMIGGENICVGCCIDFQVVTNSERFVNHPDFAEFLEVANKYRKLPSKLRIICLNHQIELCENFLKDKGPKYISNKKVEEFLTYLLNLRLEIMSD